MPGGWPLVRASNSGETTTPHNGRAVGPPVESNLIVSCIVTLRTVVVLRGRPFFTSPVRCVESPAVAGVLLIGRAHGWVACRAPQVWMPQGPPPASLLECLTCKGKLTLVVQVRTYGSVV